ncbi:hypothetical protein CBM2623_B20060 [Cupriavidus taiwanensis]|nr:hypothetical protein CBM2608_B20061 [Cupriavidus taiwanensis]SPA34148.1 hypothetical protein CBM2623_B20060 [Cupriavidus taiwanensis]
MCAGAETVSVPVCLRPSPACGRGAGERAGRRYAAALYFVDAPALSPTLSRKREREYTVLEASAATLRLAPTPTPAAPFP